MKLDLLTAISPVDGRYRSKTEPLAAYFSEYALIRYRIRVEIEYFIALCELPLPQLASFDHALFERLRDIYRTFGETSAQRVKDIEAVTNHDVKAVEYFIKEELDKIGHLEAYKEFIHFGLTSQHECSAVCQRGFRGRLLPTDRRTDSPVTAICR